MYLRYNAQLEKNPLQELELAPLVQKLDSLRKMEVGENCRDLMTIGERAAQYEVADDHFPAVFNLGSGACL